MNVKQWLDYLHYKIGKQHTQFKITKAFLTKTGETQFTKWKYYLDCTPKEQTQATHRQQLKNEIVFDLDEGDYQKLIKDLKRDNITFYIYQTKSGRARHIHTYWKNLIQLPKHTREKVREKLILKYGCDPCLKSDKHMVAMEHQTHWKTGEKKELITKNEDE